MVGILSSFSGQHVVISVDGEEVYSDRPYTDHLLGAADTVTLTLPKGAHVFRVEIEGEEPAERSFFLREEGYLGVSYSCERRLSSECASYAVFLSYGEKPWNFD